jgi:hypothetical protein
MVWEMMEIRLFMSSLTSLFSPLAHEAFSLFLSNNGKYAASERKLKVGDLKVKHWSNWLQTMLGGHPVAQSRTKVVRERLQLMEYNKIGHISSKKF